MSRRLLFATAINSLVPAKRNNRIGTDVWLLETRHKCYRGTCLDPKIAIHEQAMNIYTFSHLIFRLYVLRKLCIVPSKKKIAPFGMCCPLTVFFILNFIYFPFASPPPPPSPIPLSLSFQLSACLTLFFAFLSVFLFPFYNSFHVSLLKKKKRYTFSSHW